MFLVERHLKANANLGALKCEKLENIRVRIEESCLQVVAQVMAADREQAESIATEILGE